jgi:hypothetical protein
MLGTLIPRIATPSPGADEIGLAGQTSSATMVISAGVEERLAAQVAQWMRNEPDLRPTHAAQVLGIAAVDSTAASTATGRIKPVHQPIKTICERRL